MEASVQQIREHGDHISKEAEAANEATEIGAKAVNTSIEQFDSLTESVEDSSNKVNQLSSLTREITGFAEAIKEIAFQTNLLSLNASVEAARAGEHGRGFAVVASEVRNLATRSSESTKSIEAIIRQLQEEMQRVVSAMDASLSAVEKGKSSIGEVGDRMHDIKSKIASVSDSTNGISDTLREQSEASSAVANGITRVANSSGESVSGTERIVDAMDQVEKLISTQIGKLAELNVPDKVVKLAQSDHVLWKKRLANMIIGREGLNPDE